MENKHYTSMSAIMYAMRKEQNEKEKANTNGNGNIQESGEAENTSKNLL